MDTTSLQMSNAANNEEINHPPPMRRSTVHERKPRDYSFPRSKVQKQPRRGMGVEKLERLRIQERYWKKMTETKIQESIFAHSTVKPGHDDVTQLQNQQKFVEGYSSFQGKNVNMMVTEINVSDEHCSLCISKKKRVAGGNLGEMRSDVLRQMSSFGDSTTNFPGLRFRENNDSSFFFNQKIISVGIQTYKPPLMPPQLGSCAAAVVTNTMPVVEIVAVHKKGSAEDGNSTVLMEYDFFPSLKEKTDHSHQKHDDHLTTKMSNNIKPSEASCSCKYYDYYYQGNNPSSSEASVVDLSLKLWY